MGITQLSTNVVKVLKPTSLLCFILFITAPSARPAAFASNSAVLVYHKPLYHFAFYLINFGIPFGSRPIKSALARHSGVQVPVVPAKRVTWSYPPYGSTWVVIWLLFCRSAPSTFPVTWSTFKGPFRGVPSR